jgi:SHS2 domain-containing protein
MTEPGEVPVAGVRGLEHTADVGLEVEGKDLPQLFLRGALGAMWVVLERAAVGEYERDGRQVPYSPALEGGGEDAGLDRRVGAPGSRALKLTEEDLPALFRSWLRALLFWEETQGFVVTGGRVAFFPVPLCSAPHGQAFGLQARVEGIVDTGARAREIKGVTLHDLAVERRGEGWYARVIFDV